MVEAICHKRFHEDKMKVHFCIDGREFDIEVEAMFDRSVRLSGSVPFDVILLLTHEESNRRSFLDELWKQMDEIAGEIAIEVASDELNTQAEMNTDEDP